MKKFVVIIFFGVCFLCPDLVSKFAQMVPMWISLPIFGGVVCFALWREGGI